MGCRCHCPISERGGVRAHLLSTHRCRTAQTFFTYSAAVVGLRPTVAYSVAAASPVPNTKRRRGIAVTTTNPGLIQGANQPWLGTSVNDTTRRRLP
jgi:hypothetical protein